MNQSKIASIGRDIWRRTLKANRSMDNVYCTFGLVLNKVVICLSGTCRHSKVSICLLDRISKRCCYDNYHDDSTQYTKCYYDPQRRLFWCRYLVGLRNFRVFIGWRFWWTFTLEFTWYSAKHWAVHPNWIHFASLSSIDVLRPPACSHPSSLCSLDVKSPSVIF